MNTYEQIEAYLQGEMTAIEKEQFEVQMQADADLSSQFKAYRQAHEYLQNEQRINAGEAILRTTITGASNQQKAQPTVPAKVVPMHRRWRFAATAAAACVAIFLLIRPVIFNAPTDPKKLYSQYASFENFSATRGNGNDSLLQTGKEQFNKKNYQEAIIAFNSYLSQKPGEAKIRLARAYALIETGNYAGAETDLLSLEAGTSVYQSQATWYRALSLLKQGKTVECKQLLQTISVGDDMYGQAQGLISALD